MQLPLSDAGTAHTEAPGPPAWRRCCCLVYGFLSRFYTALGVGSEFGKAS